MSMLPSARPRITSAELELLIAPYGLDRKLHPLLVVGQRAYYRDSMGVPGKNDRGEYDDAISLVSPNGIVTFNGNTDPSEQDRTGLASLVPGIYHAYKFDMHRGKYMALCQRSGQVIVHRDGTDHYKIGTNHSTYGLCVGPGLWKGDFGINIHRGGINTTSSLGCQTIPPSQWDAFYALASGEAKRLFGVDQWRKTTIPYLLIDRS